MNGMQPILLIMAIGATFIGYMVVDFFVEDWFTRYTKKWWVSAVGIMVVLYAVVNAMVYSASMISTPTPQDKTNSASVTQAASYYGLKSDTQYPLELGERFAGTSGNISFNGNFFFIHGSGSWTPATAVSIGFSSQDKSYILEIPMSKITFVQSSTANPSVNIHIDPNAIASNNYTIQNYYSACHARVSFGWWYCHRALERSSLSVTNSTGLSEVIQSAFVDNGDTHVTITLTPEQYQLLLRGGNPAPSSTSR
mgnify:FL=1